MRYMIIVKATEESEAGVMPEEEMLQVMADYHEELAKAGVLLEGTGLQPSSKGWRIKYSGGKRSVVDGPFAETKEADRPGAPPARQRRASCAWAAARRSTAATRR